MDKKEEYKKLKLAVEELDGILSQMTLETRKKYLQGLGFISLEDIKKEQNNTKRK